MPIKKVNIKTKGKNKMFKKIVDLYKKYEEVIMYLIFGVLTTVVNFVVYFIAIRILGDSDLSKTISNALAWFFSVLFAFFTNKIFVFKHKSENAKDFILEAFKFYGCRAFSGILDIGLFALLVSVFHFNDVIVKIFMQILVIVLNYIFSKLIIFKNKKG